VLLYRTGSEIWRSVTLTGIESKFMATASAVSFLFAQSTGSLVKYGKPTIVGYKLGYHWFQSKARFFV
jgi:hypothetical protein